MKNNKDLEKQEKQPSPQIVEKANEDMCLKTTVILGGFGMLATGIALWATGANEDAGQVLTFCGGLFASILSGAKLYEKCKPEPEPFLEAEENEK